MIKKSIALYCTLILLSLLFSNAVFANCLLNPKLQPIRSRELQKLVKHDQLERKNYLEIMKSKKLRKKMVAKDLARRKRVGEIFAEGCITSSKDYLAAALIFQHGNIPDHSYQAYIWSKKAADLGDINGKYFSTAALDRYLVETGKKQLFGTQSIAQKTKDNKNCFCVYDIEPTFPDSLRKAYSGFNLKETHAILLKTYPGAELCQHQCSPTLKPTPKGSVPGVW